MNLSSVDLSQYEKYNKKLQDEYSSDESNLILIKKNTESYYETNVALIIICYHPMPSHTGSLMPRTSSALLQESRVF